MPRGILFCADLPVFRQTVIELWSASQQCATEQNIPQTDSLHFEKLCGKLCSVLAKFFLLICYHGCIANWSYGFQSISWAATTKLPLSAKHHMQNFLHVTKVCKLTSVQKCNEEFLKMPRGIFRRGLSMEIVQKCNIYRIYTHNPLKWGNATLEFFKKAMLAF